MGKLFAKWMLHWFAIEPKGNCVTTSKDYLALSNLKPDAVFGVVQPHPGELLRHFIIGNKTWILRNTAKTHHQSK